MSEFQNSTENQHTGKGTAADTSAPKKITARQIGAILCILLLIGLYIGAIIAVCLDDSGRFFAGVLGSMIGLPILLWLLIWSLNLMKKRREENLPPQSTDKGDDTE